MRHGEGEVRRGCVKDKDAFTLKATTYRKSYAKREQKQIKERRAAAAKIEAPNPALFLPMVKKLAAADDDPLFHMLKLGKTAQQSVALCTALQADTNNCAAVLAKALSAAILGFIASAFESNSDLLNVTCTARGAFNKYLSTAEFDAVMHKVQACLPVPAEPLPPKLNMMGVVLPPHLDLFVRVAQEWQNTVYEHISTRVRGKHNITDPPEEWPVLSVLSQQQQAYYLAGPLPHRMPCFLSLFRVIKTGCLEQSNSTSRTDGH